MEETVLKGEEPKKLVDNIGRLIPSSFKFSVLTENENPYYSASIKEENCDNFIPQSTMGYRDVYDLYIESYPKGTKWLSFYEYEERAEKAKELWMNDWQVSDLSKRAHFPVLYPQYNVEDYGASLQNFFLPALESAYKKEFFGRRFINHIDKESEIVGEISVIPDVGHNEFVSEMAKGPGMFWYHPNSMNGFSVVAQREVMPEMKKHNFSLSGPIDTTLALTGFSKYMAKDSKTPRYYCSAVRWRFNWSCVYFKAHNNRLSFGEMGFSPPFGDGFSAGLSFIG